MSRCVRQDGGCGKCETPLDFDFTMAFQPIVDLAAVRISGYEALVRGTDNASAASILARIDGRSLYRFDQQCRVKAIELADRLDMDATLSINFLPNAVYDPHACIQTTLSAASEVGWSSRQICFEIVETEHVADRAHLSDIASTYREYGFSLAIDDFGTGYANLDLLVDLEPHIIKLDRHFVQNIHEDRRRQAAAHGVVALARTLGIDVIGEGVETMAEARWLYQAGVSKHQGYLYARPALESLADFDPGIVAQVRSGS